MCFYTSSKITKREIKKVSTFIVTSQRIKSKGKNVVINMKEFYNKICKGLQKKLEGLSKLEDYLFTENMAKNANIPQTDLEFIQTQ